jgi:hypothetical protein
VIRRPPMGAEQSISGAHRLAAPSLAGLARRLPELEDRRRALQAQWPHAAATPRTEDDMHIADFISEVKRLSVMWANMDTFSAGHILTQWEFTEKALRKVPRSSVAPAAE